jgi:hypothetical protein
LGRAALGIIFTTIGIFHRVDRDCIAALPMIEPIPKLSGRRGRCQALIASGPNNGSRAREIFSVSHRASAGIAPQLRKFDRSQLSTRFRLSHDSPPDIGRHLSHARPLCSRSRMARLFVQSYEAAHTEKKNVPPGLSTSLQGSGPPREAVVRFGGRSAAQPGICSADDWIMKPSGFEAPLIGRSSPDGAAPVPA